MIQEGIPLSS